MKLSPMRAILLVLFALIINSIGAEMHTYKPKVLTRSTLYQAHGETMTELKHPYDLAGSSQRSIWVNREALRILKAGDRLLWHKDARFLTTEEKLRQIEQAKKLLKNTSS